MFVLIFSNFVWNVFSFSFWEKLSEVWSEIYIGLRVERPPFLSDFDADFRKWEQNCYMRTDGRTDGQTDRHNEPNSRFSQFWEHTRNVSSVLNENNPHRKVNKTSQQEEWRFACSDARRCLHARKKKVDWFRAFIWRSGTRCVEGPLCVL